MNCYMNLVMSSTRADGVRALGPRARASEEGWVKQIAVSQQCHADFGVEATVEPACHAALYGSLAVNYARAHGEGFGPRAAAPR